MINLHCTDPLTLAERHALELQYDGPVPPQAVEHVIAQRGAEPFKPTVESSVTLLKFIRIELERETAKRVRLSSELVEAVAEWDIAPAHDKQRRHNIAQSKRRQIASQDALIAALIADESACVEQIEALLEEPIKLAAE